MTAAAPSIDPDAGRAEIIALLAEIATGDRRALRALYDRTSTKLFGICARICSEREGAEDVLQDVYVSVWHRAATFDPERASPMTWLATIARNRAIDWKRSRHRVDATLPVDAASDVADDAPAADALIDTARGEARLHACLDTLEMRASEAIREAYFGGFSYAELAVRRTVPLGTMKSLIRRGLERLRKCLTDGA